MADYAKPCLRGAPDRKQVWSLRSQTAQISRFSFYAITTGDFLETMCNVTVVYGHRLHLLEPYHVLTHLEKTHRAASRSARARVRVCV